MYTPIDLENDFCKFLKTEIADKVKLKGFDEVTKKEVYKKPQVVKGFILPKLNGTDENNELPYICFRMNKIDVIEVDKKSYHKVDSTILIGCYCSGFNGNESINDGSGYRDIWNVMETIRQALFNGTYKPKVLLQEKTFSAEMPEEQFYPIWEGKINVSFFMNIPEYNTGGII